MKKGNMSPAPVVTDAVDDALRSVERSFERLCLTAGMEALSVMMEADVEASCGPRHGRVEQRQAHRWGRTRGRIGFHGGKVEVERPRVRGMDGREVPVPSWQEAIGQDWLGRWAMNLMLINVSTRRFGRAVRLPEGDVPANSSSGVSKSATSRRFVALSSEKLDAFMTADLSQRDLLVIQIDGLHVSQDLVLVAAIGIDGEGGKHPLALVEGATENTATVQALLDNLVERGLDPVAARLFVVDGAKALSKAIRATFGRKVAIQRCQIHTTRTQLRIGSDRTVAVRLRAAHRDDMADLQAAVANDDAFDDELQDRLLVIECRGIQPCPSAVAEGFQAAADGLSLDPLAAQFIELSVLAFEELTLGGEVLASLRQLGQANRTGFIAVEQTLVGPRDTIEPGTQVLAGGAVPHCAVLRRGREAIELCHQSVRTGQQLDDMRPHGGFDFLGFDGSAWAGRRTSAHDAVLAVAHVNTPLWLV